MREDQMKCPNCGGIAESDSVDVGVGLYVRGNFACSCGWEIDAEGKMNVAAYDDYFVDHNKENSMRPIAFIQYLRPNGHKQCVQIERPDPVVVKADFIRLHGFRFEVEELMTGQVSMTIADDNDDYAIRICENGPAVPENVDDLILTFDVAAAIKQKALANA